MELKNDYQFRGRVTISGGWQYALILLQHDFKLIIYLPSLWSIGDDDNIPEKIEGQIEGWDMRVHDGYYSIGSRHGTFRGLTEKNPFTIDEKTVSPHGDGNKIWTEMTLQPETIIFSKVGSSNTVPDKWGLTYFPEANNKQLWYLFNHNRNSQRLPNILTALDRSLYFDNSNIWSLEKIRKRLKLLTSCLSLFTSAPVSYQLLVGRFDDAVICFQIKNYENSNAFVCPSTYNGCIRIKDEFLKNASSRLIDRVEKIYSDDDIEKINVIFSYFSMLYMSFYDEAKVAFSYLIMESLSKYKKLFLRKNRRTAKQQLKELKSIQGRLCPSCWHIIEATLDSTIDVTSDDLDVLVEKAIGVIKADGQLNIPTSTLREIMRHYRNQAFHGDFFEEMNGVDKLLSELPEGYKRDFPIVCQAIVSAVGAHLIFGIGFEEMIAVKRKLSDDK